MKQEIEKLHPKKCEGECQRDAACEGEVHFVEVSGNGFKGSFHFAYCEAAIQEDERRGFTVKIIER